MPFSFQTQFVGYTKNMNLELFFKSKKIKIFNESEVISDFDENLLRWIKYYIEEYGYIVEIDSKNENTIRCTNTCSPFYLWKFHSGVKYIEYSIIKENGKIRVYSSVDFHFSWLFFLLSLFYLPPIFLLPHSFLIMIPFLVIVVFNLWKIPFIHRLRSLPVLNPEYNFVENKFISSSAIDCLKFCHACGNNISDKDTVCSDCGIKIID